MGVEHAGRAYSGYLRWALPPSLEAVELALMGNLGRTIAAVGETDIEFERLKRDLGQFLVDGKNART